MTHSGGSNESVEKPDLLNFLRRMCGGPIRCRRKQTKIVQCAITATARGARCHHLVHPGDEACELRDNGLQLWDVSTVRASKAVRSRRAHEREHHAPTCFGPEG